MELSPLERWMVSNQLRILEQLYPGDAENFAVQREALEEGYELAYSINLPIDSDTMSVEDCSEVWDTLDMFLAIDSSIRILDTDPFENHSLRKFCGYDGNEETKFMAFTSYTVERLKRWTHLPLRGPDNFNSHCPMRPTYKGMSVRWRALAPERRFSMNQEQVGVVLGLHSELTA